MDYERRRRQAGFSTQATEVLGRLTIKGAAGPFQLTARADRIDFRTDIGLAIIDYKTGKRVPTRFEGKEAEQPDGLLAASAAPAQVRATRRQAAQRTANERAAAKRTATKKTAATKKAAAKRTVKKS